MANLSSNIDNGAIAKRLQQRRQEQPRTRKHKPPLVELSVEEELLALEADGVRVVHHRQPICIRSTDTPAEEVLVNEVAPQQACGPNPELEILADLLELAKHGCKVAWPPGWDASRAAFACSRL